MARAREDTAGRLKNPARSTCPRTSTLRISHFPDPHIQNYNRPDEPGRPLHRPQVDNRREPEGRNPVQGTGILISGVTVLELFADMRAHEHGADHLLV